MKKLVLSLAIAACFAGAADARCYNFAKYNNCGSAGSNVAYVLKNCVDDTTIATCKTAACPKSNDTKFLSTVPAEDLKNVKDFLAECPVSAAGTAPVPGAQPAPGAQPTPRTALEQALKPTVR